MKNSFVQQVLALGSGVCFRNFQNEYEIHAVSTSDNVHNFKCVALFHCASFHSQRSRYSICYAVQVNGEKLKMNESENLVSENETRSQLLNINLLSKCT